VAIGAVTGIVEGFRGCSPHRCLVTGTRPLPSDWNTSRPLIRESVGTSLDCTVSRKDGPPRGRLRVGAGCWAHANSTHTTPKLAR
jgi:hypothetical protein